MICRTLQISSPQDWRNNCQWLEKRRQVNPDVEKTVAEIIADVSTNGDEVLIKYTRQFDCKDFDLPLRVSEEEITRGAASVSVEIREQISAASANIRDFHDGQREKSWFMTRPDGSILGQYVQPVEEVGLYVPGGQGGNTPLISSLLMNAIPAQAAGCERIAVVTPPREDGTINPYLLAVAHLLDIEEVYRVGGAWSIAALALGTKSINKVDLIAGPGNIYVATAKRQLQGTVGIDMIAGPSEILILADGTARAACIAADMLAQAEHDPLASAICIVTDWTIADAIGVELGKQLPKLPRKDIAEKSLTDWGCIGIAPHLDTAIEVANMIAPEHLEICMRDPWAILPAIRNAGAIFMGQNSPEAAGDYFAGPNHVLPTLGTARFSSALSVQTFCKKSSIIAASQAFLEQNRQTIASLARLEGLEGHARSIEVRNRLK